jgi:hypothetical protein
MKVGEIDVLVTPELEAMIEEARQAIRDAGLPKGAEDRIQTLGFHCSEHGTTTTVVVYAKGCIWIHCWECRRDIAIIAVAERISVVAEIGSNEKWN